MTSDGPTSVYRYYDRSDILIYVGITGRGIRRNREHNGDAEWWPFVARQEVEHYETRTEALAREKDLIHRHRSPFNQVHNPDYAATRAAYIAWSAVQGSGLPLPMDARKLAAQLKNRVPLYLMEVDPDSRAYTFATRPEHYAVASRILMTGTLPTMLRGPVAAMSIEKRGQAALITVRHRKQLPSISLACAKIRFVDPERPTFRINSIIQAGGV